MTEAREESAATRLREQVDRFIPAEVLAADVATRRRARLCVFLSLVGALAALAAVITQGVLDRPLLGVAVTTVGMLVSLGMTQLVRLTKSVRASGHILTAVGFLFMSTSAVIAGGLGTPRALSLVLIPMLATLLVGWRGGLFWIAIIVGEIGTMFALTFVGPDLAPEHDLLTLQRAHGAGIIIILIASMLVIASYDRANAAVAEELEEALERAGAVNRLKSALVANVSHELRTPLNGVLGSADLLMRSGLDPAQREHAETIEASSEALLKLVDDLLDTSRLEAGGMELEVIPIALRGVLGQALAGLAPVAEARRGGRLVLHVEPDVPENVVGDPYRLRQVFTNLLNNAIKFTDSGHVVLHVSLAEQGVRFEVRDTGPGIEAEHVSRLFEAFEQAEASTARQHGGTGLGLSIARQLVELMGSEITVSSEPGVGSTFSFVIELEETGDEEPVERHEQTVSVSLTDEVEAAAARAAIEWAGYELVEKGAHVLVHDSAHGGPPWAVRVVMPSMLGGRQREEVRLARPFSPTTIRRAVWRAANRAPSSRPPRSSASESRGHVLVADDNLVNRRVAAGQLAHLGFEAEVVENGREAVKRFFSDDADFVGVILDLRMPEMDGYEAANAIRAREREEERAPTPLFALTAHEEPGQRKRAAEVGFDLFLVKPLRIGKLETVLEKYGANEPRGEEPVLDEATWDELEMLAEESPDFLPQLVDGFIRTAEGRIEQLRGEGDVCELAHAFKGASRQMGIPALADACQTLEKEPERKAELLPEIEHELERGRTALFARLDRTTDSGHR